MILILPCFTLSICAPCFLKGGNAWLMNFCPTLDQYLFKIYTNICFTQRQEIWSSQLQWSWFCRQNVKLQTLSCSSQGGLSFHKCKIDFGSRNPMNDNIATERREELWKYSFGNPNIKILEIQTSKEWKYCNWMKGWNCKDIPILA